MTDSKKLTPIPQGSHKLKLGETFGKNGPRSQNTYHTLRYDFKPKSVSGSSETFIAFGDNFEITVAFAAESGDSLTVFKGSQKATKAEKECILLYNHETGELRLEQLASNIVVKKTRGDDSDSNRLRAEIRRLRGNDQTNSDENEMNENMSTRTSDTSEDGSNISSDSDDEEELQNVMEKHLKSGVMDVQKKHNPNMTDLLRNQDLRLSESSDDD